MGKYLQILKLITTVAGPNLSTLSERKEHCLLSALRDPWFDSHRLLKTISKRLCYTYPPDCKLKQYFVRFRFLGIILENVAWTLFEPVISGFGSDRTTIVPQNEWPISHRVNYANDSESIFGCGVAVVAVVVTVVAGDVAVVVVAAVVVAVAAVHNQSHERNFFFPFLPKNNFNEMLIDGVCQMSKISQNKSKNRNFILIHSIG